MTIRFIAELTCDHAPCTETAQVGVSYEMESGCSPMGGGGQCRATVVAETHGTGWQELTEGKVWCPLCWADQFRFEVKS
jgi:hypothetical protein